MAVAAGGGCGETPRPPEAVAPAQQLAYEPVGGDAEAGDELYSEHCAACHGGDLAGTESGPSLRGSVVAIDAESLLDQIRSGRGAMPAFERLLDDGEIRDVATYVANVARRERTRPAAPPSDTGQGRGGQGMGGGGPSGDAAVGERVFANTCASCHGGDGGGSSLAPAVRGLSANQVSNTVTNGAGAMPSFQNLFAPQEIAAVAAYVASLEG